MGVPEARALTAAQSTAASLLQGGSTRGILATSRHLWHQFIYAKAGFPKNPHGKHFRAAPGPALSYFHPQQHSPQLIALSGTKQHCVKHTVPCRAVKPSALVVLFPCAPTQPVPFPCSTSTPQPHIGFIIIYLASIWAFMCKLCCYSSG